MSGVGRNDPCPCGSGKKHKHCCLGRPPRKAAPGDPDALYAQGMLAYRGGRADAAIDLLRRAIAKNDSVAAYHLGLARSFSALRRYPEAIAAFERVLTLTPADPNLHVGAGLACAQAGRTDDAAMHFERALSLDPAFAMAHYNLGVVRLSAGHVDEAVISFQRALDLDPKHTQAQLNLGTALVRQGQVDAALACFKHALELKPDDRHANYNLGLAHLYADAEPGERYTWHRHVASHWEAPFRDQVRIFPNAPDPERRLKLGYVSPDFRQHSIAYFIEPVLAHHDRSRFEIYCYFNDERYDGVSERIERLADHWRSCHGMSDEQLAARIEQDGIDILVDLAGHMAGNRLPVFARKPAPVQVNYLGYPATTGLTAMDYRLVSADTDPPGEERWHSEELWRLPRSLWCYRPPQGMPEVATDPPVLGNGFVTFGSMNNISKLSPRTIRVWTEIMRSLPGARLVLTGIPEHAGRAGLYERFESRGVDAGRLFIHDRLPIDDYWKLLGTIDVVLDPFPYNGTTTTCETLWAGVPVVSLIGRSSVERSGYALLKSIGLTGLAVPDEAAYIASATGLGSDPQRLQALRSGLRERIEASALRDEPGFTRDLEAAYCDMWRRWCSTAQ